MALTPTEVLDAVSEWNLVQVKEFVDAFCEKFDVEASAPAGGMMMAAMPGAAAAAPAEAAAEQTEFTVHMKSFGPEKIKVIKEIRAITGQGLKEAKDLVESAPCDVMKDVPKEEAEKVAKQLKDAGAEVEVK
ncbi:50S ribosomal protein L7/L12 [Candidatus Sumerlaeota bacterium]|nr:50S ribosomal protein L7/L12 [Candidatus Sumerlaeota bacterium]